MGNSSVDESTTDLDRTTGRHSHETDETTESGPSRSPSIAGKPAADSPGIPPNEGHGSWWSVTVDIRDRIGGIALTGLLLVVVLNNATGSPVWLTSEVQAIVTIVFAGVVVLVSLPTIDDKLIGVAQLFLTGIILGLVLRQRAGGIPTESRGIQLAAMLVLFVVYPFVRPGGARWIRHAAPFVVAAAAVVGAHFYHVSSLAPGSAVASFPIVVGLILLINLFFIPQYITRQRFFWATSRVSALVVVIGLAGAVGGPYRLFGFGVQFYSASVPVPLLDVSIPVMTSTFANPNSLGLLAFAGTVTALVEAHETFGSTDPEPDWYLTVTVVVINTLGLFLSFSRASWLATVLAVGLYGAHLVRDRRILPWGAVGLVGVFALFLGAIATGILPVDSGNRFGLWTGALETYLAGPTLLGEGIVVPEQLMRPHVGQRLEGQGPHNSYLMILIRAGLVGLLGYLVLTVGSLVGGCIEYRSVDVGVLALAFGWVCHQLFEAYTLFQYTTGAVLASIAIGYLIVDRMVPPQRVNTSAGESLGTVFESGESRES